MTAVGPSNKVPDLWLNYLKDATNGDEELEGYLKRVAGYCLTGSIAEHAFFFCYGTGGNGKGIYKDMLDWMLHSYARAANIDTFTDTRFTRHSAEIAYFQGARLVTSTEPGEGSKWAEGRIKAMTGGDPITANYMHQNPFTFAPLFKLLFTGNFKPQLKSVDEAIRRRLYLIPFEYKVTPEKKDLDLPDKLRVPEIAGGILHWMIEGCLEWQETMLKPPQRVIYATSEYLESEDRIGRFLDEHVEIEPSGRLSSSLLFLKYKNWADVNNEFAVSKKRFNGLLQQKGFKPEKRAGEQIIMGMSLKD
jgi:P4 family phage/plasmid primase-like protien